MSFNLDGSTSYNNSSIPNLKCNTISGLTIPNLININSNTNVNGQLDVNGPIYISGITNIGNTLIFSNTAGNSINMVGNGIINDLNRITPTSNNPLVIDNNNNSTKIQLNNCVSPSLKISTVDNGLNWIASQFSNNIDNTSVVMGVISGNALIGAHNANRTAWTDLFMQYSGKLNVGLASNVEKFNVSDNIRTDSGSFYKGSIDMFKYKRFTNFGGTQISISNTTYLKIYEFVYLGSNISGNINMIYLSANPNGNTLSFKITDDVNSTIICENTNVSGPGSNGIYTFSSISNLTYFAKPYSLYAKINAGTGYWNSGLVYFDWFNA